MLSQKLFLFIILSEPVFVIHYSCLLNFPLFSVLPQVEVNIINYTSSFSSSGLIHELRLMMEFSGFNQGFGIVEFFNKAEATQTIELTNDYELRPRLCISVVKSVDNCRPFVGNLPKDKSSNEIKSEMVRLTEGVKECIVYRCMPYCFISLKIAQLNF